jgi:hypothetical protein
MIFEPLKEEFGSQSQRNWNFQGMIFADSLGIIMEKLEISSTIEK